MKNLIKLAVAMIATAIFTLTTQAAPQLQPCNSAEMARFGASHVIVVDYTDIATVYGATTNTLVIFTNTVTAPVSLKFAGWVQEQSYDTAPQVWTNAKANISDVKVSCGTYTNGAVATSTNLFVNGVQVAADQTPTIYGSFGDWTAQTATITATGTTYAITFGNVMNNQTSNIPITITYQPNTTTATNVLGNLVKGRDRFYFNLLGKYYKQ